MRQKSGTRESSSEQLVKHIRRVTRKQYSSEEKIRIVLEGLRGECSIAELCGVRVSPRACIPAGPRSSWRPASAGGRGDTARAATSSEVTDLRREARQLKEVVAEQALALRLLKKNMIADGETRHEIPGRRATGNHPPGRAIPSAGTPNAGQARYPCPRAFTDGTTATRAAGTRR